MSAILLNSTLKRSENSNSRRISISWSDSDKTREIEISISHYKERKAFHASVVRANVRNSNGFTVKEYEVFSDIMQLGMEPIARFSMAKLSEFADKVLLEFINSNNEFVAEAVALANSHRN